MESPDVASKCGVTCPRGVKQPALQDVASKRGVREQKVASPDVASKRNVTCQRGIREPAGIARCVASPQVSDPHGVWEPCRGVNTWRH